MFKRHCLGHPQVQPDGQQRALHYRYRITPQDAINAYKPKELDASMSRVGMRSAMLGAIFKGKYNNLPQSDWVRLVWEARSMDM